MTEQGEGKSTLAITLPCSISEENPALHELPGLDISLESLAMVRVCIERSEDFAAVRAVCQKRLGELPTVYVTADVCRPELLVEIEGVAGRSGR